MKKSLAIALIAITLATLLASCGSTLSKPTNGTYKSDEGILSQTWTFTGSNEITLSAGAGLINSDGTYSINGTKMSITSMLLGMETTTSYTITEITAKSFFIDGTKFVKQ